MSINILLVSDSQSDCFNVQRVLSEHQVLTATNKKEVLNLLEGHEEIHLLLLDMDLADRSGIKLLESIKAVEKYQDLRTILMGQAEERADTLTELEMGIIDFIEKPLDLNLMKAKIHARSRIFEKQNMIKEQAEEQSKVLETILNQVPIGIGISLDESTDLGGSNKLFNYNPEFEKICGRDVNELMELGWNAVTHPDDLQKEAELFKKLQSGTIEGYAMDKRIRMPDNSYKWVHIITAPLNFSKTDGFHYVALLQDIDEEKRTSDKLSESERSKSVLLSNLQGMAYRCLNDRDWTMEFVSSGCYSLCGCPPDSLIANRDFTFNALIAPEYREKVREVWSEALADRAQFKYEYEIIDAYDKRKWVMELGEGVFDDAGQVEALEGIIIDISDRKEMEDELRYVYEHDDFTGLFNLNFLDKVLRENQKACTYGKHALLSINLNSMYSLSLKYGMQYSQKLIQNLAKSLEKLSTHERMLFSSPPYRFVFYVRAYEDRQELRKLCEQILNILHSWLDVERIDFGIGVYEFEDFETENLEKAMKSLLIASDEALASSYDESSIYFYDQELEQRVNRRYMIQQELALIAEGEEEERIFLQFQPIVDLKDNCISEFEALARFKSKELGLVAPLEFIPVAEETKDIIPIGKLILRKACKFLKRLQSQGHHNINISINISPVQILSKGFVAHTIEILSELDVNPENIIFELTESIFSEDYDQMNAVFRELSKYGIRHSIDDFGTAYSSLSRLRELNVNTLKIDKPFIDKLNDLREEVTITNDIISMAHKMDLMVVAEGVETKYQLDYLTSYDCDKVQGYLVSRPLDEDIALEYIKNWDNKL
ncbi:MAG: EAL domain-containing protein [Eubacteriales bacterium]|nr:EAL domain-containing protein [Eubacteriales bacterium]MDD4323221.1 EAL domain-containing protein [Eubacteriales bacterium]